MTLETLGQRADALRSEIAKTVQGQDEIIDLLLVALFAQGHVLLEGPPGTAKTLLARSFASAMDLKFDRIQFTPDLMPGDVLGASIFNFKTNAFILTKGPVFTQVLLSDEINRAPPNASLCTAQASAPQSRPLLVDLTLQALCLTILIHAPMPGLILWGAIFLSHLSGATHICVERKHAGLLRCSGQS